MLRLGGKKQIDDWTRTWGCLWRVNTAPVGGPILTWDDVWTAKGASSWAGRLSQSHQIATWRDRQVAIDAEVAFLNDYFLNDYERGN